MNEYMKIFMIVKLLYNQANLSKVLQDAVTKSDNSLDNIGFKILDMILKEDKR